MKLTVNQRNKTGKQYKEYCPSHGNLRNASQINNILDHESSLENQMSSFKIYADILSFVVPGKNMCNNLKCKLEKRISLFYICFFKVVQAAESHIVKTIFSQKTLILAEVGKLVLFHD